MIIGSETRLTEPRLWYTIPGSSSVRGCCSSSFFFFPFCLFFRPSAAAQLTARRPCTPVVLPPATHSATPIRRSAWKLQPSSDPSNRQDLRSVSIGAAPICRRPPTPPRAAQHQHPDLLDLRWCSLKAFLKKRRVAWHLEQLWPVRLIEYTINSFFNSWCDARFCQGFVALWFICRNEN